MSSNPQIDALRLGWSMMRLATEAQMVMTMRMAGLAGFWTMPPGEAGRMVAEKSPAFVDAYLAGTQALWHGASVATATGAALAPLHRKARSNRRRLTRR